MSELVPEITAAEFESLVKQGELVALDFYSDECAPCAALAPKFDRMAELYGSQVKFYKIFRQQNRELAAELGVRSSPSVLFFKRGAQVGPTLTGGVTRAQLVEQLDALVDPEFAAAVHAQDLPTTTHCEVLIVGGGPAGLTAGIYAAQAKKHTIVVDLNFMHGGQVATTHLVSNYPGFVEPISGMMLGDVMGAQARAAGVEFRAAVDVSAVDVHRRSVLIDGIETITADKMILAMGAAPRPLGVPGELEFKGQGVSYCATCDAKYYQDQDVVVIGGGNSALEEALFIAEFASKVRIVHQFDHFQANAQAQEKVLAHPKIEVLYRHEPREFVRTAEGMQVVVENLATQAKTTLETAGIFVFVGMQPNLAGLESVTLDEYGYIEVDAYMRTNIPHVFAAGDVASKPIRQITVAVAEGTIAAVQACRELT